MKCEDSNFLNIYFGVIFRNISRKFEGLGYLEIIFSNFEKIVVVILKSFKKILGRFQKMFEKMYE